MLDCLIYNEQRHSSFFSQQSQNLANDPFHISILNVFSGCRQMQQVQYNCSDEYEFDDEKDLIRSSEDTKKIIIYLLEKCNGDVALTYEKLKNNYSFKTGYMNDYQPNTVNLIGFGRLKGGGNICDCPKKKRLEKLQMPSINRRGDRNNKQEPNSGSQLVKRNSMHKYAESFDKSRQIDQNLMHHYSLTLKQMKSGNKRLTHLIQALATLDLEKSIMIILSLDDVYLSEIEEPIKCSFDLFFALRESDLYEIKEFQPFIKILLCKLRLMLSQTQFNKERNELSYFKDMKESARGLVDILLKRIMKNEKRRVESGALIELKLIHSVLSEFNSDLQWYQPDYLKLLQEKKVLDEVWVSSNYNYINLEDDALESVKNFVMQDKEIFNLYGSPKAALIEKISKIDLIKFLTRSQKYHKFGLKALLQILQQPNQQTQQPWEVIHYCIETLGIVMVDKQTDENIALQILLGQESIHYQQESFLKTLTYFQNTSDFNLRFYFQNTYCLRNIALKGLEFIKDQSNQLHVRKEAIRNITLLRGSRCLLLKQKALEIIAEVEVTYCDSRLKVVLNDMEMALTINRYIEKLMMGKSKLIHQLNEQKTEILILLSNFNQKLLNREFLLNQNKIVEDQIKNSSNIKLEAVDEDFDFLQKLVYQKRLQITRIAQYKSDAEKEINKQEQTVLFKTFVHLRGTYDQCYARRDAEQFDLESEIIQNFINDEEHKKRLLLILGRSGSGKNVALRQIYNRLIQSYDAQRDYLSPLPIYFNMSAFAENETLVKKIMQKINSQQVIQDMIDQRCPFLIFLDGWEEYIHRTRNIYEALQIDSKFRFKIMVTCRVKQFTEQQIRSIFSLNREGRMHYYDKINQIFICPFDRSQQLKFIRQYLSYYQDSSEHIEKQYKIQFLLQQQQQKNQQQNKTQSLTDIEKVKSDDKNQANQELSEWVCNIINDSPSLQEFSQQPFNLYLVMQVFPQILQLVESHQKEITSFEVYKCWVIEQYCRQFWKSEYYNQLNTLCQKIAYQMLINSQINMFYQSQLKDQPKSQKGLAQLLEDSQANNLTSQQAPLKQNQSYYQFLHIQFYWYFAARFYVEELKHISYKEANTKTVHKDKSDPQFSQQIQNSLFNQVYLSEKEFDVILHAAQIIISEEPQLIHKLRTIISLSKKNKMIDQAASNAISILNQADYNFYEEDLSDVSIPKANLSSGQLNYVNFKRANLTDVKFNSASLLEANFDEANIQGVSFGLTPDLIGHQNSVLAICSYQRKDKNLLFSGSADCKICVWSLETFKEVKALQGHKNSVNCITYSNDDKYLISGGSDNQIKIWNLDTLVEVKVKFEHKDWVNSVCCSMDGKQLYSASKDCTIKVWNLFNLQEIKTLTGHTQAVNSICCSPNDKYLISGSEDKSIKIWCCTTLQEMHTLTGHNDFVLQVCTTIDSKYIISGSFDQTIKIWSLESFKEIATLKGHSGWIDSVCCSPDGRYIISCGWDKQIKIWNLDTFKNVKTIAGHDDTVKQVCCSSDCKFIFAACNNNVIKIWNYEVNYGNQMKIQTGHQVMCCSVDKKFLFSGSEDATIKVWHLATFRQICTIHGHIGGVLALCCSPNGKFIYSGSRDSTIKIWSIENFKIHHNLQNHSNAIMSLSCTSNGKFLISGSEDKSIKIWQADTLDEVKTFQGNDTIVQVLCSFNCSYLISRSKDSIIKLWNLNNLEEITSTQLKGQIQTMCCTQDSSTLIVGCDDLLIYYLSLDANLKQIKTVEIDSQISALSFSNDGQYLFTACSNGILQILNAENLIEQQCLYGPNVTAMIFVDESQINQASLITSCCDKSIIVWRFNQKNQKGEIKLYKRIYTEPWCYIKQISFKNLVNASSFNQQILQQHSK